MGHRLDMTVGASDPGIQVTSPTCRLIAGAQHLASRLLGVLWDHSCHLTGCLLCLSPQVEGYAVGCECSPCGDLLVTGSADGRVLMFSFRTASRACTLQGHAQACLGTTYHPVLPSVLGTCSWGGDIKIWH